MLKYVCILYSIYSVLVVTFSVHILLGDFTSKDGRTVERMLDHLSAGL